MTVTWSSQDDCSTLTNWSKSSYLGHDFNVYGTDGNILSIGYNPGTGFLDNGVCNIAYITANANFNTGTLIQFSAKFIKTCSDSEITINFSDPSKSVQFFIFGEFSSFLFCGDVVSFSDFTNYHVYKISVIGNIASLYIDDTFYNSVDISGTSTNDSSLVITYPINNETAVYFDYMYAKYDGIVDPPGKKHNLLFYKL